MENRNYHQIDEDFLNIKELIFYILRKWRILILAGVLGVILGCLTGFFIPEKSVESFDLTELNLEEIGQYARYQQLYQEQLRKEQDSVYLNLDPQAVQTCRMIYYISAPEEDITLIGETYKAIFRGAQIYTDLIEASGLECSEMAMQELAAISFSKYDLDEVVLLEKRNREAKIIVEAVAPNEEACQGMKKVLEARVQEVNELVRSKYPDATIELLSDVCRMEPHPELLTKRDEDTAMMATYVAEMEKLEKKLTDDDKLYYGKVYAVEEEDDKLGLKWLKWGLIAGVLFGGMMVVFYGVVYLLDGHVKTLDELRQMYGLHLLACLGEEQNQSGCAIDRMLRTKLPCNNAAYLQSVFSVMGVKSVHLCGNMENAQLAAKMKQAAGESGMTFSAQLATDAHAQQMAKAAEGVVLFVQLWNTKHAELVRELEIAHHINARVLGVVVID
ncbi:MAG: hypothetical protein IKU34_00590 [Clostridia bacterium]|nr:hypothetical protein [Clostridia bacterium]